MTIEDRDEIYQKGLIITDNFCSKPILDFDAYRDAIVKIVKNSYPNFAIGIFGEWGTGKTSLMNSIKQQLEQDNTNIKTIWFDAWKYENEKQFALIPLLKTINFSLETASQYNKLKEALREAAIFTLGVSQDIISATVTSYVGNRLGGLFQKTLKDVTGNLIPRLKELNEVDKNAIFYNGIENIQKEIDNLRIQNKELRFIIFIDDLDRCSPNKVLEILESIKIFLQLNGFIYILGISHDTIVDLINKKYHIDGEKYLRKFIQIPITLTEWNESDIESLIKHLLDNKIIHNDYKDIIEENLKLIATSLEENPRETKRFLNNLIISYEVFVKIQNIQEEKEKKEFLNQLLLIQILNSNWKELYRYIIKLEKEFFKSILSFIPLNTAEVEKLLLSKIDPELQNIFEKYKSDKKFLDFFNSDNCKLLSQIEDWNIFRRALKLTDEQSLTSNEIVNEKVIGDVLEINKQITPIPTLQKEDYGEINKINEMLHPDEEVLLVAKQSRIKPGGSPSTPNTIYATDRRIIIRDPYMLGTKANVVDIPYDIITSLKLEKGLLSSTIRFKAPGLMSSTKLGMMDSIIEDEDDQTYVIEAIPKDKAEDLLEIIRLGMNDRKSAHSKQNIFSKLFEPRNHIPSSNLSISIADELEKLAKLKEGGILTEEELNQMKQELLKNWK